MFSFLNTNSPKEDKGKRKAEGEDGVPEELLAALHFADLEGTAPPWASSGPDWEHANGGLTEKHIQVGGLTAASVVDGGVLFCLNDFFFLRVEECDEGSFSVRLRCGWVTTFCCGDTGWPSVSCRKAPSTVLVTPYIARFMCSLVFCTSCCFGMVIWFLMLLSGIYKWPRLL